MAVRKRDPQTLLPLSQPVFGILLALGDRRMHGYGIMQTLTEMTNGRERLLPGSLYASMSRMIEDGLIEETSAPAAAASGGPKRRYYKRTPFGTLVARAETERMRHLVGLARNEKALGGRSR